MLRGLDEVSLEVPMLTHALLGRGALHLNYRIVCPDGVCTCALRSRRLLEIMVVTIPAAEFPLIAVVLILLGGVVILIVAVIVVLCRPAPRVIPRVNAFENLKFA